MIISRRLVKLKVEWNGNGDGKEKRRLSRIRICAVADQARKKMNLNEYMVTLERPLGIRFALSLDGRIFVYSLKKGVSLFSST